MGNDDFLPSKNLLRNLFGSIKRQNPHLSNREIVRFQDDLLKNLSKRMDQGYYPAAAKPNLDGTMDVIVMSLERLRKGGRSK